MIHDGCNDTAALGGHAIRDGYSAAPDIGSLLLLPRVWRPAPLEEVRPVRHEVLNTSSRTSALQALGARIGVLAIGVWIFVYFIGIIVTTQDPDNAVSGGPAFVQKETVLYMILISVTVALAAIPEGIPLCVTISPFHWLQDNGERLRKA